MREVLAPSILPTLPGVSAGRTARELWWTSQEFFPAGIIIIITTMALHAHISPQGIGLIFAAVLRRKSINQLHAVESYLRS
jgi:hypothetical protein